VQEDFRLIVDLVTVLVAAVAGGMLAALGRQPILLGYLVAGMAVGPAGLGLIKELIQVETLAQIGVAFLLFTLGVKFSFAELRKVQAISLGGGGLQIALTLMVTTLVSLGVGWVSSPSQGVFLGAILSLSSTAVVLKSLAERNETETPHGQVMLGILIVQDLAVGLMLAVLPALDKPPEDIGLAVGWALLKISLFAVGAVIVGRWLIPPLLRFLARTESRELFLLGVVALCMSIAIFTDYLGLSIEMGAFVAGLMISDVEYVDQTLSYVEPLRDIFATLFFAAIGMLIDPVFLWDNLELILGLVALVVLGKFLIITPIVKVFRYPLKTAIIAGLGLAQIGEFSFVLASEGQALGLVSRRVYLLILGTTAVTLVLTPFLLRLLPPLFTWMEAQPWLRSYLTGEDLLGVSEQVPTTNHIVVCGYGRVGQNIVQLLQAQDLPVVVIDQSEEAIEKLREAEIAYIYGNAASSRALEKAGLEHAKGMAIALPDAMNSRLCLKRALEFTPELDIVVRATHDQDIEALYQLGAREVVQPEFEASLELSTHLLTGMGLSQSAIQQNISQIRSNHYATLRPEQTPRELSREAESSAQWMNSKWYTLPEQSTLVGMTLEEADLRRLTGVSVMSIRRSDGEGLSYPEPQVILQEGDRLLLIGEPAELEALEELARGERAFPGTDYSCQWLTLPPDSSAVGQTLARLDIRRKFGVQIQAIRRQEAFMRFPTGDVHLQVGDRLLLCGSYAALCKLGHVIAPSLELQAQLPQPATVDVDPLPATINSATVNGRVSNTSTGKNL
jgi:monovalent cation:H+ antiporter-2, CPA2 family